MLLWSWGRWPDLFVDFGRELYVPWRLAEGDRLYTDLTHLNGPLSPYLNSLWFQLFGVSLRTLVLCNLAILVATVALIYRLLTRVSDRLGATIACLVFVSVFAFGRLDIVGNYNYITPYAHEITHGLLLAVLAVYALSLRSRLGLVAFAVSGLSVGLTFLTKPEVFLAATVTTVGCGALALLFDRRTSDSIVSTAMRRGGTFVLAALAPPCVAVWLLTGGIPFDSAVQGILGPYVSSLQPEIRSLHFYRAGMGTLQPGRSVVEMFVLAGIVWAPFAATALMALRMRRLPVAARIVPAVMLTVIAPLMWLPNPMAWTAVARPLPLFLLVVGIGVFITLMKHHRNGDSTEVDLLRFSLVVFAFVLMTKILLNASLLRYGFVLAMPATLLFTVALTSWVPLVIDHAGGSGRIFRVSACGFLLVMVVSLLQVVGERYATLVHQVGQGRDTFLAGPRASAITEALAYIDQRLDPDGTVAVVPEGVMLNYLGRWTNPTPFINLMPPEVFIYGEDEMLASFKREAPDYVAVVHKSTQDYGFPFFGQDYGQTLYGWIGEHYEPVHLIGEPPLRDLTTFGIEIRRRMD